MLSYFNDHYGARPVAWNMRQTQTGTLWRDLVQIRMLEGNINPPSSRTWAISSPLSPRKRQSFFYAFCDNVCNCHLHLLWFSGGRTPNSLLKHVLRKTWDNPPPTPTNRMP